MFDENEYSRWIKSAYKTIQSAYNDLRNSDYNWSCFKAHQAAEKAIKSILWGVGKPRTSHSLVHLIRYLAEELHASVPEEVNEACIILSKFYTITRYPDAWSEGMPEEYFSAGEAEEAIKLARLVLEWAEELWKKLLGKESS